MKKATSEKPVKPKTKSAPACLQRYDCAWCDDCLVPHADVYVKDGLFYHKKCDKQVEKD